MGESARPIIIFDKKCRTFALNLWKLTLDKVCISTKWPCLLKDCYGKLEMLEQENRCGKIKQHTLKTK